MGRPKRAGERTRRQRRTQLNSEGEEVDQEWDSNRGNLNLELAAQYEQARRLQRMEEEGKSAAQGQRRSGRQRGEDMREVGCRDGTSVECQAWREATLIAQGELVVPRLRSRQRGIQGHAGEEVQIVATVVETEGKRRRTAGLEEKEMKTATARWTVSRGTPGQMARGGGQQWTGEKSAGKGKKEKGQPQGGVPSDRGQRSKRTGVPGDTGDRGKRGREASRLGGVSSDSKRKRKGGVASDKKKGEIGQGPGWNSKQAVTGFPWNPKKGRIKWADGSEIVPPKPGGGGGNRGAEGQGSGAGT